jgi:hypothetical protein
LEYLEDVSESDRGMTGTWSQDASGVLTFVSPNLLVPTFVSVTSWKTAIFSATVTIFIVESYKMLSPTSGDQTVFLLGQVSQQLAGLANGTDVQPQPYPPFSPRLSIIYVNGIWLLSLVLSTTSALFATLTQQWAHRYLQLPQNQSMPRERARVRSILFLGTLKYRMHYLVGTAPTLLHISLFLFNVGLVIFFFTIYKPVAIVVLISVAFFGAAYFIVTILPCLDHVCPYFTPISGIFWYLTHASASIPTFFLQGILKQLRTLLDLGQVQTQKLNAWSSSIKDTRDKLRQRRRDGVQGRVVKYALMSSPDTDFKILTRLLQSSALAEKIRFERFAASLSGETTVRLFTFRVERGEIPFRDRLISLLQSCAPGTTELGDWDRTRRLSVCLNVVHHIARASIIANLLPPSLLDDVWLNFANIGLMRPLRVDRNPAIRVTARSICALLARHLLRKGQLEGPELAWLQDVIGQPAHMIHNELYNFATVDSMNVDSFVYGVLAHQTDDLSIIQATSFTETLAILMNSGSQVDLRGETFENHFSSLIQRVEQGDHEDRAGVVDKLRKMYQGILSTPEQQLQMPDI